VNYEIVLEGQACFAQGNDQLLGYPSIDDCAAATLESGKDFFNYSPEGSYCEMPNLENYDGSCVDFLEPI
jgi:hypothetical protein